jgi:hypothetical protein
MEPALSTLAEIAANLLKLERRAAAPEPDRLTLDSLGWDALMPLSAVTDAPGDTLPAVIHANAGAHKSRITVLRLIDGGLA